MKDPRKGQLVKSLSVLIEILDSNLHLLSTSWFQEQI